MKSSKLSFIIIIVLALVVGLLSFSYLSSSKTIVYTFNDNYVAGTPITKSILTETEMDTDLVVNAYTKGEGQYITEENLEEVIDSYLKTSVLVGMPLMSVYSDEIGGTGAEKRLEPNMVAITIEANNITGASPNIEPEARVNIYSNTTYQDENVTDLLYQNIRVIDVLYEELTNEASGTPTIAGVVVELDVEQSIKVQHATEYSTVKLGLVKTGAYEEVETVNPIQTGKTIPNAAKTEVPAK